MATHGSERIAATGPRGGPAPEGTGYPALRALDASPNNLPVARSSFVGRERELAELGRLLVEERLVTLTGAGGCGKTRLAVQAASETLGQFPDGAWWVELEPLADERLVGAAIAEALGVRPLPGMTELQAAGAYLTSRRTLIILDNCEHLLKACAEAAEALLGAAPELVVLATSRSPLGVSVETQWRVPSLSLPQAGHEPTTEAIAGSAKANGVSDAVALFIERANAARPDLALGPDDTDSVAAICTELDGMPLAIELAAARLRILSVAQIAAGLSDRFRLLSGGPRTATPRLKTMRASVEWSYELLSHQERALLRRLSVFAGGLILEAVDEVCAGDGIEHEAVLDLLASLVDQSLVLAEEQERGAVRYRLLETVRQYGLEQLAEAGEEETIRARHRDYFLALAEEAGPLLETARQSEMVQILDPEAANLAAAFDHAVQTDPRLALRFGAALHRWWCARGRFAEAELAYAGSLQASADREPGLRARVLQCRAWVAASAGEVEAAEAHATEALALADEVGDQGTAARARVQMGRTATRANPSAARSQLARAAELARAAGDDWALVDAQQFIADTYWQQGDHVRAAAANDEVAALAERLGDPLQVAHQLGVVFFICLIDGRLGEAREAAERTHAAVQAVGEPVFEAFADWILGTISVWVGDPESALERLNRRLERAMTQGAWPVPFLLAGIAIAELTLGRLDEAVARLEAVVPLVEGRWALAESWTTTVLAETRRLRADDSAEPTARRAQAVGEELGNRWCATWGRLTVGRLAAARGEWADAREHALAHLEACVEGGHATYLPPCLDALGEVAAGIEANEDAVRLLSAAERARAEIGIVRVPPEAEHWAAIDDNLREALGDEAYDAARAQGAEMSTEDAVEWARRSRGPRGRPPGGWDALTPTELKVVELVAEGLTNPQVAERMFVAPSTVKTHLAHIFRKLDVHSRAELSARAGERNTIG
jgi:predicted ATPase/DNA-binding CsgD family transcriptional regulator